MREVSFLFSDFSLGWILVCVSVAVFYAYLLYGKQSVFTKPVSRLLAVLRAILVFLLCLFLFSPLLKRTGKILEKPIIVLLQDNSASLLAHQYAEFYEDEYPRKLDSLKKVLNDTYDLRYYTFGSELKVQGQLDYSDKRTDIAEALRAINNAFVNRNLAAVILASDGIYNQGADPLYISSQIKAPLYTIALGDTLRRKDLMLKDINYNKLVYLDNNFALQVMVAAYALPNKNTRLSVLHNDKQIHTQTITIDKNDFFVNIPVTLSANEKGLQKYTIRLSALEGEINLRNNERTIFVEVLEAKQKIVLIAHGAHPDLAALKHSIESNKNYSLDIRMADDLKSLDLKSYQLAILHQLPSASHNAATVINQLNAANTPIWFIIGNQTHVDLFNRLNMGLQIKMNRASYSESLPMFNSGFYLFSLSDAAKEDLRKFPPLSSPFGDYSLSGDFETALLQGIGSVQSDMPLLSYRNSGMQKYAVLVGEGIWKWRLHNFQLRQNHQSFDELISKSVQYLSARDDKRKFRLGMAKNIFDEYEHILFNAELYNDSYELMNEPEVQIDLKKGDKSYKYVFSKTNNAYVLDAGVLPVGDYTYAANVSLGKNKYEASGSFSVSALNLEETQIRADHQLLNALSSRSGGEMYMPQEMHQLPEVLRQREDIKTVSFEQKKLDELISLKSVFFLLVALVSLEWFIRKRSGAY